MKVASLGLLMALFITTSLTFLGAPTASAHWSEGPDRRIVIRVEQGERADKVADRYGVDLIAPLSRSHNLWLAEPENRLRYTNPRALEQLAKNISRSGDVDYAERYVDNPVGDSRMHAWPQGNPDQVNGENGLAWRNQPTVAALGLPNSKANGAGVIVAVLDTGASSNVAPNASQIIQGYDYIEDDNDASEERRGLDTNRDGHEDSAYGHGTFIAGQVNLVAPFATILPYRVLDSDGVGNVYVIAEAINDAVDAGAGVINMSFGSEGDEHSDVLDAALARAVDHGVVIIASAGNTGRSNSLYPANASGVLSVACADPDTKKLAWFSSYGSWVDVAAPCDQVGVLPDFGYARWTGTSLSAPLVAGQAALIRSRYPQLSRLGVVRAIKGTANCSTWPQVATGLINIGSSIDEAPSYD